MASVRPCYEVPADLLGEGILAPDSTGVPAPPVDPLVPSDPQQWLPAGHHWSLHIEHDQRIQTGPFVGPVRWGLCWHITVSSWQTVDSMRKVLHDKSADVHFVIGGRAGREHAVVIQCLPLNQFGKGLVHLSGRPETNRAYKIQIEICATPDSICKFERYRALANLAALISHGRNPRVPIPNRLARSFSNIKRFTDAGYPRVTGHHGHMHVPQNNHPDPITCFEGPKLVALIDQAPHDL